MGNLVDIERDVREMECRRKMEVLELEGENKYF